MKYFKWSHNIVLVGNECFKVWQQPQIPKYNPSCCLQHHISGGVNGCFRSYNMEYRSFTVCVLNSTGSSWTKKKPKRMSRQGGCFLRGIWLDMYSGYRQTILSIQYSAIYIAWLSVKVLSRLHWVFSQHQSTLCPRTHSVTASLLNICRVQNW